MPLHDFLQRDGPLFAPSDAFERAFGQMQVLEIFQVLDDGLPDIVGLGAPCAAGQLLQAFFDGLRKSNGQHTAPRYTSIACPGCGQADTAEDFIKMSRSSGWMEQRRASSRSIWPEWMSWTNDSSRVKEPFFLVSAIS
jgi:hypothetical protein